MQHIGSLNLNKNKDNQIFINIIDEIKYLIIYTSILKSKGFPDYFMFKLIIENKYEKLIYLTQIFFSKKIEKIKKLKNILKKK